MPYYYGVRTFISGSLKHLTDDFKDGKPDTIFAVPMVVETFYKQIIHFDGATADWGKLSYVGDIMKTGQDDWCEHFWR